MKRFLLPAVFVLVVAPSISAADVSGKWILKMDRDFRGNPGVPVECTFKQRGTALTVKCGNGAELKGDVRGRKLRWGFEKTGIPPMLEDRLVLIHIAEVGAAGDSLTGTWRLTSGVLNERGTFTARKQ